MAAVGLLCFFGVGGVFIAFQLLPRLKMVLRVYIGLSIGIFTMMWLPVLWAHLICFTKVAHGLAAGTLLMLCLASWLFRDRRAPLPFDEKDRKTLLFLLWTVLPLTVLSAWLQYSHSIRPAADGSYHVGQSTYGDLSLHLAVCTSIVNAKFPLENSLMVGATMAYPYLGDSLATSLYMFGLSLPMAMTVTGTVMMGLVYTGFALLARQLCRRRGGATLAFYLLFLNGGLGFLYTFDATTDGYSYVRWIDNLREVFTGYYQTPTNQPDPHNLRWVNIVCDMLLPQRGILAGWTLLMPCLNLLLPGFSRWKTPSTRALVLLGLFAGGMPLCHTHSYLALVLLSAGMCAYDVITTPRGTRLMAFRPWLLYGSIAAALSLPQLLNFTFVQATESDHFLALWFNWANNRGNYGLADGYLWFYLKNVGIPYLLIWLPLLRRKPKGLAMPEELYQHRIIATGAILIYLAAELFKFQPNEYDNNKLLYVWFLLCLPMAADYALELWEKLREVPGRRVLAGLFLVGCFTSSLLTVGRECISDYPAYDRYDIEIAEQIQERTPEHSVFLTGDQHLNPVSSLAGRTIVCSSNLYLYYHGFNTAGRQAEIAAFYSDPAENLDLIRKYGVQYIYVSAYERSDSAYDLNEEALEELFPLVCETEGGRHRVYAVPEEYR